MHTHLAAATTLFATTLAIAQAQVPCYDTTTGTNLTLGDDAVAQGLALGFTFPGPAGPVTSIDVASNGFLWLGSSTNSRCCTGNAAQFVTDGPSIAACWMDLNPSAGGSVTFQTFPGSGTTPARAVITWDAVPEFGATNVITAQVQLLASGEIVIFQDPGNANPFHDMLMGVTQGNGATPNPLDFSAIGSTPVVTGSNPTVYEEWAIGALDVQGRSYQFVPNGSGGYIVLERGSCRYGGFQRNGIGCPTPLVVYEEFSTPSSMDLNNVNLLFQPTGAGGLVALSAPFTYVDPTRTGAASTNLALGDDQLAAVTLPFPFVFPGGTTTLVDVDSNGNVLLQGSGTNFSRCCNGDPASFAGDPASIATVWQDLNPAAGGGVYTETDPTTGAFLITWHAVPEYFSGGNNSVQLALFPSGAFEIRTLTAQNLSHTVLVGFSGGSTAIVPPSRDFTASVPFTLGAGGAPLELDAAAGSRPVVGQPFSLVISSIPANTVVGSLIFGFGQLNPPLDLAAIGMTGCSQYISLDAFATFVATGSSYTFPLTIPNNPVLQGYTVYTQASTLSPGFNPLGVIVSNGGTIAMGL